MLTFLSHLLIATVALLLVATALVFTVRSTRPLRHPIATALLAAVVVGVIIGSGLVLLGEAVGLALVGALAVGATVLIWRPVARDWDVRGLLAWALTVDAGLLYLLYIGTWTLTVHPGAVSTLLSGVMWLLEAFIFLIGAGYVWELVDVLARRRWSVHPEHLAAQPGMRQPFVSLHVPTHNEPPDMVIESLERMLELDYEAYEILVVDNNTTDPSLWRPLEEYCARHERLVFIHLEDWPGFKSGALNYALTRVDPRTEIIGIVDADYHVASDFLAHCAPLFNDDEVAFVQTPQDYRDWRISPYFERLYHSYGYFFDVSQRSRNERNGAIFGGTMGLIRRDALVAVGGWDEWCITEDAELSLRLLRTGAKGLHIDRAYGRGVMPLSFESLKGQRFRWCFGGIQILRMHWRSLLPGRRTQENRLTMAQRWAYLVGGLQWFGDLATMAFTAFLALGALDAVLGSGLVVRRLSGMLLLSTIALVVLGAVRSIALVRQAGGGVRWRTAAGAFGLWMALGLTVARASWLGLVSRQGTFLRTPKVKGEPRAIDAVRGNRIETLIAVLCAVIAVAAMATGSAPGLAVGALLSFQALGFALAPLNSLAAIRTDLPADLRRRRGWLPSWGSVARPATRGGAVLAATAGVLAIFAAFASPVAGPGLADITRSVPAKQATVPLRDGAPRPTSSSPHPSAAPAVETGAPVTTGATSPSPDSASASASAAPSVHPVAGTSAGPQAGPTAGPTVVPSTATSPTAPASAAPTPSTVTPTTVTTPTPGEAAGQPTSRPTSGPTSRPTQAAAPSGTRPMQAGGRPTTAPSHP